MSGPDGKSGEPVFATIPQSRWGLFKLASSPTWTVLFERRFPPNICHGETAGGFGAKPRSNRLAATSRCRMDVRTEAFIHLR